MRLLKDINTVLVTLRLERDIGMRKVEKGIIYVEIVVSLALLGLLLGSLAVSFNALSRFNKYQQCRRQAIAAGQSQLDCLAATGVAIDETNFKRLWEGIEVVIEKRDGDGEWKGLEEVTVVTSGQAGSKKIEVRQKRYMAVRERR